MYKQLKIKDAVIEGLIIRIFDNAAIPFATGNKDYQEYLNWIAEGNEPLPADE